MGKVVFAFDSFKGSLSAMEAGRAAARGLRSVFPGMPFAVAGIADGGEGTLEAVMSAREGRIVTVEVSGPYGKPVSAQYGICGDLAIVEIARAAGLNLSDPAERNPVIATTYGVGELIADALGRGARRFMIGLGGSATNDAGIGMLQALGWRFLDARGREIERGAGAESAGRVRMVDDSGIVSGVRESSFTVACDVTASLTGPLGATYVFGPQKGLRHEDLAKVDGWLGSFARVSAAHSGSDLSEEPGAGAAGGLGYAFRSYLGARMEPGIEMVLDAIGFDELLEEASLVITGEGRLDRQTCMGKAPSGVLRRAAARGIPVIAIGGCMDPEAEPDLMRAGFAAVFPAVPGPVRPEEAMRPETAAANVERTARQVFRLLPLAH